MKRLATAALILALGAATAAMADGRHDRNDRHDDHGRYDRDHRDNDRRDDNRRDDHRWDNRRDDNRRDDHRWDNRRDDHRWDNRRYDDHRYHHDNRYRAGRYYAPPGYRARHWGRGDRLPRAYYARPYVIGNYHSYRLRSPPRGCHYVRVNNDVVLAAIATGVILDVFYNHFY
jgi:Ni/Co efflux regulator RcnB